MTHGSHNLRRGNTMLESAKMIYRIKKSQYLYKLRLEDDYFDECKQQDMRIMLNDAILKYKGFANRSTALRFLKSEEDKHIVMFQNMLDSEGFKILDYGVVQVANYFLKMAMLEEMERLTCYNVRAQ